MSPRRPILGMKVTVDVVCSGIDALLLTSLSHRLVWVREATYLRAASGESNFSGSHTIEQIRSTERPLTIACVGPVSCQWLPQKGYLRDSAADDS